MLKRLLFRVVPFHFIMLLTSLFPNTGFTTRLRGFLVRPLFKRCGCKLRIASGITINHLERIEIGNNVYIAHNSWINGSGGLKIGNNVQFGPMVVISTSNHIFSNGKLRNEIEQAKVIIGDDVWLGSHVTVTAGSNIGANVIIGANGVVTKSIPSNSRAFGVPCNVV